MYTMVQRSSCMLLVCLLTIGGCMNAATNKDEDIAAIVRGEEIKVGYLRLLYPDDVITDMVDEVVKAKLAKQEMKKIDKDVSEQIKDIEASYGEYHSDDESYNAKSESIRAFTKMQADKLGMEPHEYHQKYVESSAEMMGYVHAYVAIMLGGLEDDEFGIEEYDHHANELLDNLVEQNKDAIDIRIK